MSRKILVLGAMGYLGSQLAISLKLDGNIVFGIGHGNNNEVIKKLDGFQNCDITLENLRNIKDNYDIIINAAGSGSVGYSENNPEDDYKKTVESTKSVTRFMQKDAPKAKLIQLSSPAVLGSLEGAIKEKLPRAPISVYGKHKKNSEEECEKANRVYKTKVNIIRFFSVYGNGLKKQLIWDASNKLFSNGPVTFLGTGEETRDFIHISDVIGLVKYIIRLNNDFLIINGGTGKSYSVNYIVNLLKKLLNSESSINFDGIENIGNPRHYKADVSLLKSYGWMAKKDINTGLKEYAEWIMKTK